jgi:multidrug transporter EmrE-like cation transporter
MSLQDLIPLTIFEIIGDFNYKTFANKGTTQSFAIGTLGYVGVVYFLIRSLQGSQVLLVNAAWDGISALVESVVAYFYLGERFENYSQYLGILLIVVGLFFLKIPLKPLKLINK